MSSLLISEYPLIVLPSLAKAIGLNEAIVLQQIHYWKLINQKAGVNKRDGYYWMYATYEKLQGQLPFWSIGTIKRTITSLKKQNLIIVSNYNKLKIDKTNWYRVNYPQVKSIDIEVVMGDKEDSCPQNEGKDNRGKSLHDQFAFWAK